MKKENEKKSTPFIKEPQEEPDGPVSDESEEEDEEKKEDDWDMDF
jgi:hypothetical protein